MKSKGKSFIINLVVYPFDILVSIAETNDEFLKSIKKYITPECLEDLKDEKIVFNMPETCNGRTVQLLDGGQTIMRLPKRITTCEQYGTLAHEIFHAVEFIMRRINIKLSENSDECFAYLIGYVTTQIYKKM